MLNHFFRATRGAHPASFSHFLSPSLQVTEVANLMTISCGEAERMVGQWADTASATGQWPLAHQLSGAAGKDNRTQSNLSEPRGIQNSG